MSLSSPGRRHTDRARFASVWEVCAIAPCSARHLMTLAVIVDAHGGCRRSWTRVQGADGSGPGGASLIRCMGPGRAPLHHSSAVPFGIERVMLRVQAGWTGVDDWAPGWRVWEAVVSVSGGSRGAAGGGHEGHLAARAHLVSGGGAVARVPPSGAGLTSPLPRQEPADEFLGFPWCVNSRPFVVRCGVAARLGPEHACRSRGNGPGTVVPPERAPLWCRPCARDVTARRQLVTRAAPLRGSTASMSRHNWYARWAVRPLAGSRYRRA